MRSWVLILPVVACVGFRAAGQTITDDFNGGSLSSSLWGTYAEGTGKVIHSEGRVVTTIGPSYDVSFAAIGLLVAGDFDAQVDYTILNWPHEQPPLLGVQINFDPMGPAYEVVRTWNCYASNFSRYEAGPATSDMNGRLRMVRRGATFSAYYYDPVSGWQLLRSTDEGNLTEASILSLGIYGKAAASVAFDNFSITLGSEASVVSAASFVSGASQTAEGIASIFGQNLAASVVVAPEGQSLPGSLGGVSVTVTDSSGVERTALLWFVSPQQINLQIPPGTAPGLATVSVKNQGQTIATGVLRIEAVAPSLFSANATGEGVAAADALWVRADGSQDWKYVFQCGAEVGSCSPVPLDAGTASEPLFLLLYGTGIRGRSSLDAVAASIGGTTGTVEYAGPVADLLGLDQVNVRVPPELAGKGEVNIVLTVDGKTSNTVTVNFR